MGCSCSVGKQSQLILKPTDVELGLQVGVEFDNFLYQEEISYYKKKFPVTRRKGPALQGADRTVKNAMGRYWKVNEGVHWQSLVLLHLSNGLGSNETFVQGTLVSEDFCPRDIGPRRLLSKV